MDPALETHADTNAAGETPETLQSAVGDVRVTSPAPRSWARWALLGTVALAATWVWLLMRPTRAPESPSQVPAAHISSVESAERQPVASAPASATVPPRPNAMAPSAARPAPPAVAASASRPRATTAATALPRAPLTSSPPPAASYPAPAASQVTFDEKNPY